MADEIGEATQQDIFTHYEVKLPEQYAEIRVRVDDEISTLVRQV